MKKSFSFSYLCFFCFLAPVRPNTVINNCPYSFTLRHLCIMESVAQERFFSIEKIAENEIVAHEGGFIKDSPSLAVIFTKISMEENPVMDFKCALLGSKEAYEPYSSCDRTEFVLSFCDTTVRSEGVSYQQLKGYRTNRLMKLYDETGTIVRYVMANPGHMNTDPGPQIELTGFPAEMQESLEVSMTLEFYEGETLLGALKPICFSIGFEDDSLYLEGSDRVGGLNYYYECRSVE